jgi:predicted N-acetyltransferase YhbS
MKSEFVAAKQLSEAQKASIKQLRTIVYPETMLSRTLVVKQTLWATPEWSILVWEDDELIARVGLILREIICNGEKKLVGGIGSVMAHPERQKSKGLASAAINDAIKFFDEEHKAAFAILFSGPRMIEFYKRLQWKPFDGEVFVEQPRKGRVKFQDSTVLVMDIKEQAPLNGILDLHGPPW